MTMQSNGVHSKEPKLGNARLGTSDQPQRITITLTTEDLALLDEVGKGNPSEGVRLAVRALRTQRAELKRIMARMEADPTSVVSHDELQRRLAEAKAAPHVLAP